MRAARLCHTPTHPHTHPTLPLPPSLLPPYIPYPHVGEDAISEFHLGAMCEKGEGGPMDPYQARAWYVLASMHDASTDLPASGTYAYATTLAADFATRRRNGLPLDPTTTSCLALQLQSVISRGTGRCVVQGGEEDSDLLTEAELDNAAFIASSPATAASGFPAAPKPKPWHSDAQAVVDATLESRARLGRMWYEPPHASHTVHALPTHSPYALYI